MWATKCMMKVMLKSMFWIVMAVAGAIMFMKLDKSVMD